MKYFAFLFALMIVSCENKPDWATNGETIYSLSGEPLFVVAKADFPKEDMTWEEAKQACENLGNGWRLPDKDELVAMYEQLHKERKGNFELSYYWCISTEEPIDESEMNVGETLVNAGRESVDFNPGGAQTSEHRVRAVRALP